MEFTDIVSLVLVVILLYLGFRLIEFKWSYKISKPHSWETAVNNNYISKKLQKLEKGYRDKVRFYTFWFQIERLKRERVSGAFAELGVYKGVTARIIHEMDNSRQLQLFDTFNGFDNNDLKLEKGIENDPMTPDFKDTNLEIVKSYVNGNNNVEYYPGHFPESAKSLKSSEYAFVHLDADLYKPTIEALRYFYPKLSPGGVIFIHDYNHTWEGIPRAIHEFLPSIPENIVEIADWQGSVMIVKNKA